MIKTAFFASLVGFLFLVGVVNAGTVTFDFGSGKPVVLTTTAGQDAVLNSLLVRENAARAARIPPDPSESLEDYVNRVFLGTLASYQVQAGQLDQKDACVAYQTLVKAGQDQIKSTLAGHNPCP